MPTKILPQDIGSGVDFSISEISLSDGTVSLPSLAFASDQDTDTGIYRVSSNRFDLVAGGSSHLAIALGSGLVVLNNYDLNSNRVIPNADNTHALGSGVARFSTVFAANGKPWVSMKVLSGLSLGAVGQLIKKVESLEAKIKELEAKE
jgi:hypothetical protein